MPLAATSCKNSQIASIAELENGVKPLIRPCNLEKAGGTQAPITPVAGKRHHDVNFLILGMDLRAFQSGAPRWITNQQAPGWEWRVRKGEDDEAESAEVVDSTSPQRFRCSVVAVPDAIGLVEQPVAIIAMQHHAMRHGEKLRKNCGTELRICRFYRFYRLFNSFKMCKSFIWEVGSTIRLIVMELGRFTVNLLYS